MLRTLLGRLERISDFLCTFGCGVDHNPPINDEKDAKRRPTLRAAVRLASKMEHGDVDRRRLAGARRQIEKLRPGAGLDHLLGETHLPGEWIETVYCLEESRKVAGTKRGHDAAPSSRGRHRPKPRKRPAPMISGPLIGRANVRTRCRSGRPWYGLSAGRLCPTSCAEGAARTGLCL